MLPRISCTHHSYITMNIHHTKVDSKNNNKNSHQVDLRISKQRGSELQPHQSMQISINQEQHIKISSNSKLNDISILARKLLDLQKIMQSSPNMRRPIQGGIRDMSLPTTKTLISKNTQSTLKVMILADPSNHNPFILNLEFLLL